MLEFSIDEQGKIHFEGGREYNLRFDDIPGAQDRPLRESYDASAIIAISQEPTEQGVWVNLHGLFVGQWPTRHRALGPFEQDDADRFQSALEESLGLPREFTPTTQEELLQNPARFVKQYIEVTTRWSRGQELSDIAGAWSSPHLTPFEREILSPSHSGRVETIHRVRGFWYEVEWGAGPYGNPHVFSIYEFSPPAYAGSPRQLFGELRERLHARPDRVGWMEIIALLDGIEDEAWLDGGVLPYVEAALESWEDELRVLPPHWILEIMRGERRGKHRLGLMSGNVPMVWPFDFDRWRLDLATLHCAEFPRVQCFARLAHALDPEHALSILSQGAPLPRHELERALYPEEIEVWKGYWRELREVGDDDLEEMIQALGLFSD